MTPATQHDNEPVAANDNTPVADDRYDALQRRYGGRVRLGCLIDARVDSELGVIKIESDGAIIFTPEGGKPRILEQRDPLNFVNAARWASRPVPSREWFVQDLIPARNVSILNGDGGVGKSLLALQIAAAAAMGVETLGMEPTADRVLYIGAEDENDEFHRRLADITAALDRDLASLTSLQVLSLADSDAILAAPDKAGRMHPTDLWQEICEHVEKWRPRFIVLDTAADLFGGEEIKRNHVRAFIAMLRKLALEGDLAILLLAHPSLDGMRSGSGSSGSTAWNNSVRSRLYLTKPAGDGADPDARVLKTMKANYSTAGGEIKLKWKAGAFVLDDGKPSPASALIQARAERIFRELLFKINDSGDRVAKTPGLNYAPKIMAKRPDANGVKVKEFEAAMNSLMAAGEVVVKWVGPPSRQRQMLDFKDAA